MACGCRELYSAPGGAVVLLESSSSPAPAEKHKRREQELEEPECLLGEISKSYYGSLESRRMKPGTHSPGEIYKHHEVDTKMAPTLGGNPSGLAFCIVLFSQQLPLPEATTVSMFALKSTPMHVVFAARMLRLAHAPTQSSRR